MIVDDNATNRRILKEVLTNWRMRPVAVEGGASALATLEASLNSKQPFAVALLDAHMPDMDGCALAELISRDRRHADMKLVMLTSAGQRQDVARGRKLGISAYLTKPIKRSELFDVIVSIMAQPLLEKPRATIPRAKPSAGLRRLHVLLAEDNPVNQLVATRIFEKLGHEVTVVGNGRLALSAVQGGNFDLIAMDLEMPEMDGLAATKAIRAWEKKTGAHVPIIAMTAHAMKGDRERCLAAGMDGYAAKPIRIQELEQTVAELIPSSTARGPVSKQDQAQRGLNHAALLAGVDGNRRLLSKIVRLFLEDYPHRLTEIKEAIRRGEGARLARAAHALKGSVGNFEARNAFAAAQRLETMGRNGDLVDASDVSATLESELALLSEELRKLITSPSTRTTRRGKTKRPA